MMKKIQFLIILLCSLLVLCSVSVSGALVGYWDFEEGSGTTLYDNTSNNYDGNITNGGWVAGKVGSYAGNFTSTTQTCGNLSSARNAFNNTVDFSVSFWVKTPQDSLQYLFDSARENNGISSINQYNTYRFTFQEITGGTAINLNATSMMPLNTWTFITITSNSTELNLYVDGTVNNTEDASGGNYTFISSSDSWFLGCQGNCYNLFGNWTIDEFALWNSTLTSAEITELYNSSYGKRASLLGTNPAASNFTITATNIYDSSTINEFNATIDGVTYGTTTGTITTGILSNSTQLYDINITADNFFQRSIYDYNVSSNLATTLIKAIVRIRPKDIHDNILSLPFNLSTASYNNNSNLLYLTNGSISITFEKAGYKNKTQSFTISNLQNNTLNMTGIYQNVVNITAKDKTATTITTYSVNVTNTAYSIVVNTTNGSAIIPVLDDNYNVTIDASLYEIKTVQINITNDYTYNFSLYGTNSMNFTFKDEDTKAVLSGINISIDIIGDVNYTNTTTTTGEYVIELLYPEEYTIRYSADGYSERFYYFNLVNRTYNEITLYLSNASETSNITLTVYDEINDLVEGAIVKAQKYDITTNTYNTVEMIKTNFEGMGIMNLVKNTEYYRFIIEYNDEIKKSTNPTYIYEDSISFQIILTSPSGESFFNTEFASWSLGFNNATNNFRFIFSDSDNAISQGCLYVYKLVADKEQTLYNNTCVSASSGTILLGILATNGTTYEAKAYIYFGDDNAKFLGSEIVSFGRTIVSGQLGIFLIGIICVVFAMIGFWSPPIAAILTPLPILFGAIIGIVNIPVTFAIPLVVLGFIIAVILSGRA